jgi:hypothetical protein
MGHHSLLQRYLYLHILKVSKGFFCSGIACGKASFWFFCRVGAPPPSPEDGNRSSFRNVMFSVCRNPDNGQSPEA